MNNRCSFSIRYFALLMATTTASLSLSAKELQVAPGGSDDGDGISAPFRTIQKAVGQAGPGDVIRIRGGIYREGIEALKGGSKEAPLRIEAFPGETPIIKGSEIVRDWIKDEGAVWKKTDWKEGTQQVFVDFDRNPGAPLVQIGYPAKFYHGDAGGNIFFFPDPIGKNRADMKPGSFYWEEETKTLYVWLADGSDPNLHEMEVSIRPKLFQMRRPYLHLKGLHFRHTNSATYREQGTAVELSEGSVVENCDIQWCDFAGLSLAYKQHDNQVINCNISNNGAVGIGASATYGFVVRGCKLWGNNYKNFNPLWHAGGLKSTTQAYGIVENNDVGYNNGSGIWFDYADSDGPKIIRNNYVHDNGPKDAGIMFECSVNGLIANNLLVNNARRGIYISASERTKTYNNTIVGSKGRAAIELDGMPREKKRLIDNLVYNNLVYTNSSEQAQYDMFIRENDGQNIKGNLSDFNCVFRTHGSIRLTLRSDKGMLDFQDWQKWRSATNQDMKSVSVQPEFVRARGTEFVPTPDSPLVAAGASFDEFAVDYSGAPRPKDSAWTIGALEGKE
jgi:parallel beta-helix repeat protein